MKKVVVITSRFPAPLNKGDKLRIFHHIRELSKVAKVHLICLHEEEPNNEDWVRVSKMCSKIYTFLLPPSRSRRYAFVNFIKGMPLQLGYFFDPHIQKRIKFVLNGLKPDHIHCHLVRMAPYVFDYNDCPKSLDYMDSLVLNDMAGQHLSSFPHVLFRDIERKRIGNYERKIHEYFQSHFIISNRDKENFKANVQGDLRLLPNGVTTAVSERDVEKKYDICFCGNLGYAPNLQAVKYLLDIILPKLENVSCIISGAEAPDYLKHINRANVTIMSPVQDMEEIYQSSILQVAPIFTGSGQQNKILEAMSLGVVNLTTSFVNESIGAREEEEIVICDDQEDFIKGINTLLSRPEIRLKIAQSANNFVQRNFDWAVNTKALREVVTADK